MSSADARETRWNINVYIPHHLDFWRAAAPVVKLYRRGTIDLPPFQVSGKPTTWLIVEEDLKLQKQSRRSLHSE